MSCDCADNSRQSRFERCGLVHTLLINLQKLADQVQPDARSCEFSFLPAFGSDFAPVRWSLTLLQYSARNRDFDPAATVHGQFPNNIEIKADHRKRRSTPHWHNGCVWGVLILREPGSLIVNESVRHGSRVTFSGSHRRQSSGGRRPFGNRSAGTRCGQ